MEKIGRKIYHLSGGLLLIALYSRMGRMPGLAMLIGMFLSVTALDLVRLRTPALNDFIYRYFSKFIRDSEREKLTGTPWYLLGILTAAALYDAPVAVYAVAFLACGDVAATAVGERWGTIKVSGVKSIQGTAAFFMAASVSGLVIDHWFYPLHPAVYIMGALTAALVEILPLDINDNLTIPLVAGGAMRLLLAFGL